MKDVNRREPHTHVQAELTPPMPLRPADLTFLETKRVAHLATVDPAGAPHVVPVCFAALSGHLYVPVDAKPKRGDPHNLTRLRNLRAHPEASLLFDHYAEDWTHLRWLLIRARTRILQHGTERDAALTALQHRYPQYATMRLTTLNLPVIALDPTSVRRWSAT